MEDDRHGTVADSRNDRLELKIVERFVARHDEVEIADPERQDKCARELDMHEILRDSPARPGVSGREDR
jgi:hypothetical protein